LSHDDLHSIFTTSPISRAKPLRQWKNRVPFHTRRQLIDYWFRYITTVRVTASVKSPLASLR